MLKVDPMFATRRSRPPMPELPPALLKAERTPVPVEEREPRVQSSESQMDRLWRCLQEEVACGWSDYEVRRVTFWFDLTEHFGSGYQTVRADQLRVRAVIGAKTLVLRSAPSTPHETLISFVRHQSYLLRTDLPDPLFAALQALHAGKRPEVVLRIMRLTPCRGLAAEIGPQREFRVVRASPARVF